MTSSSERPGGLYGIEYPCTCCVLMLSISKPQTNLIYLSILVGRLDLTRFSILCGSESLLTAICLLIRLV